MPIVMYKDGLLYLDGLPRSCTCYKFYELYRSERTLPSNESYNGVAYMDGGHIYHTAYSGCSSE